MADLKISQLNALAGASLADTDVLAVVDTSASETKKITSVDLVRYGYGLISASTLDGDIIEAGTTSARGTVQLTDSTSSTSTTTAATPNAVKSAYDLGNAALPKAGGTMTGAILADDASSPSTPGYAFDGDADTGIVRTGANEMALVTGGSARITLDASGNVVVPGNFTVQGTTTTIDTTTLVVKDKNIELGVVTSPTDITADGGGITLKGTTDKEIKWLDSTDAWTFSEHVDIASAKEYRIAGTKVLDATSLGSGVVSSSLTSLGTVTTGTWSASTIAVDKGGTGQTSYTDGQLLIGNSTGNTLAKSTLTAGSNISVTNGSGSITIAATGLLPTSGGTLTGDLTLNGQSDIRFADSDSSNWVAFQAPATVASNVTWTLPAADGTASQVLSTDGTGTLSWSTAASGDVTLTGTQTLTNKTLTDPAIIGTILEDVYTITDGAAFEIDPGNGSVQLITLGASRTPKATNFAAGEAITLMVDDGSAYTLTWTDATFGGSGVVWKTDSGAAPTLNTSGYTVIVLWKVGTQVYGARVGNA